MHSGEHGRAASQPRTSQALRTAGEDPDGHLRILGAKFAAQRRATGRPDIQAVPISPLLSQISSFLPRLKAANSVLERDIAANGRQHRDIEALTTPPLQARPVAPGSDGHGSEADTTTAAPHIAMDLTCGVLDLNDESTARAAEAAVGSGASVQQDLESYVRRFVPDDILDASSSDDSSSDDDDVDNHNHVAMEAKSSARVAWFGASAAGSEEDPSGNKRRKLIVEIGSEDAA